MDQLPDSLVYSIGCYIPVEDVDCLRWINRRWFQIIGSSEYIMERQVQGVAQDVLCWTNGKFVKNNRTNKNDGPPKHLEELPMGQIYGYIPSLRQWRIFGAYTTNNNNNITEYCTVWIPSYYTVVFLGGYHREDGAINGNVWAYSFLTNTYQKWPSLLYSSNVTSQQQGRKQKKTKKNRSRNTPKLYNCGNDNNNSSGRLYATLIGDSTIAVISTDVHVCNQTLDVSQYQEKQWKRISPLPVHSSYSTASCTSGTDIIIAIVASTCSSFLYVLHDNNPHCPALLYHVQTDWWLPLLTPTNNNNDNNSNNFGTVPNQSCIVSFQNKILFLGGFIPSDNNNYQDEERPYVSPVTNTIILDTMLSLREENTTTITSHFILEEEVVVVERFVVNKLPHPIRGASCCVYGGKLTIFGGSSGWNLNSSQTTRAQLWQQGMEYSPKISCSSATGSTNLLDHQEENDPILWEPLPIGLPYESIMEGLSFSVTL